MGKWGFDVKRDIVEKHWSICVLRAVLDTFFDILGISDLLTDHSQPWLNMTWAQKPSLFQEVTIPALVNDNFDYWFWILISDVKRACELLEKLQKSKYCGEVPATKLAALQKVLQSEFLNAVREVYEHVYETVDVQGNPEIRASATAKVRNDFSVKSKWNSS